MSIRRVGVALILIAGLGSLWATRPAAIDERMAAAIGPPTDHAVGFYDAHLGRVTLVGGAGDPKEEDRDGVWSWTGTRWEVVTAAGPPGRVNAAAAYDAGRGRGVVAGGSRKTGDEGRWTIVGDTWEGGESGWRRLADLAPRDHLSLVEDGRGGILMFGGIPANRSDPWPSDTWELRGSTWRRVATEGPAARGRTALAYDGTRREVVLFGGVSPPAGPDERQTFLDDTWIWNGERWRRTSASGPRGRYAHVMVFDERAGVVLLYAGAAAHTGAPLDDMWQWDGVRWAQIPLAGPTPGHRYQPVMVYDRARGRTVLYGGIGGPADTWEWDGTRWRQASLGLSNPDR